MWHPPQYSFISMVHSLIRLKLFRTEQEIYDEIFLCYSFIAFQHSGWIVIIRYFYFRFFSLFLFWKHENKMKVENWNFVCMLRGYVLLAPILFKWVSEIGSTFWRMRNVMEKYKRDRIQKEYRLYHFQGEETAYPTMYLTQPMDHFDPQVTVTHSLSWSI